MSNEKRATVKTKTLVHSKRQGLFNGSGYSSLLAYRIKLREQLKWGCDELSPELHMYGLNLLKVLDEVIDVRIPQARSDNSLPVSNDKLCVECLSPLIQMLSEAANMLPMSVLLSEQANPTTEYGSGKVRTNSKNIATLLERLGFDVTTAAKDGERVGRLRINDDQLELLFIEGAQALLPYVPARDRRYNKALELLTGMNKFDFESVISEAKQSRI